MKGLYYFKWDCGRMGDLEGLFISTQEEIDNYSGKEVYFGEVLGKHSEIYGTFSKDDVDFVTDDAGTISKLRMAFGHDTLMGYNPIDFIKEREAENA